LINGVGRMSQSHVFIHVVTQFRILVMKIIIFTKKKANDFIEAYVRYM